MFFFSFGRLILYFTSGVLQIENFNCVPSPVKLCVYIYRSMLLSDVLFSCSPDLCDW